MPQATSSQDLTDIITVADGLRWGVAQLEKAACFYGHGTDNALDEAVVLLCAVLALDPGRVQQAMPLPIDSAKKHLLIDAYNKRATQKIPAAYITSQVWFAGLAFYVDKRVLIPRSPLAELIEDEFKPWIASMDDAAVLELGTGSGCIAIATAVFHPSAEVIAVDVDVDALAVAHINVQKHQLQRRVKLTQSDWFAQIDPQEFDLIISNPPYVPAANLRQLPLEYQHEPEQALVAGDDGLACVLQILAQVHGYLKPKGILIVEVGESADVLQQIFPNIAFTWLEFEHGGEGVFLLDAEQLHLHKDILRQTWQIRFT